MSDSDYKAGQQGLRYDRTMNKADYDKGRGDAEDLAAAAGREKTSVDGAGIGLLAMSPILAIMYPVVTLTLLISGGVLWLLTEHLPPALDIPRLIVTIAALLAAFWLAFKAEHRASEFKIYRLVRHPFRVIAIGVVTFGFMIDIQHSRNFETALDHAPPSSLFVALVAVGLMLWLGPKFDRLFFPVRDAYTIRQEKKYAGMSTLEIDDTKHADFRSRLKFAGVWLAGTIGLVFAIPHGPVALMAIGWFGVCWIGRKVLRSRKPVAG